MKNKTATIILILVGILIIGGGLGYYLYQKPVKDFSNSNADLALTAKEIFAEFEKDELAANEKYVTDDKTIEVSGTIIEISTNDNGTVTLLLDVENPDGDLSCSIVKEDSDYANTLQKGTSVKIKGQCTGYQDLINKEVVMIRCGIVR